MKRNGLLILLLAVCLLLFGAYLIYERSVFDKTPPRISIEEGEQMLQLSVLDDRQILLQGVSATDERDGDVTERIVVESVDQLNKDKQVVVTYAAFDNSGNVSKATRTVQYTDYVGPRFTLSQALIFPYSSRVDPLQFVGAEDALDGDIRHRVKATLLDGSGIDEEGTHPVRFRVTNSLGDTEELVIGVEVYPTGKYNATLSLTDYIVYLRVGELFSAEAYLNKFTMYGQTVSLRTGVGEDLQLQITGVVDTGKAGVYPVSYTVTRQYGNQLYAGYSRLIVVVEE